jgi:tetratricopeptide (TPR) repeat protein
MNELRRWSEGVLEAAWLMAAALTPMLFSVHTGVPSIPFGFEPTKVLLVRVLALLMAVAWIADRLAPRGAAGEGPARPWWRTPLGIPLLAYVLTLSASALVSLEPAASVWGASVRLDGILTLASYLVVFATVAARLRRRGAVERLFDVMVVATIPVCLYSLMQAGGLDPIDWLGTAFEQRARAFSMLGNPIFAGAYLVLLLPVTLAWGLESWSTARRVRALVCAVAFVLQLAALLATTSRGPWIAAVAGLFTFGVLAGAARRRKLWTALAFAPAVGFALFVLVLNVPRGPLEPLRETPALRRLAHLFDKATPDLSGRARYLIWRGAFDLVRPRPPMLDGQGRPDRFHGLRPFLGYGMEAFGLAFSSVYDVEFVKIERRRHLQSEEPLDRQEEPPPLADRAHNEFWDSVVFAGWLGGAAHLALQGAILALVLRVLRLETGSSRWRFGGYLGVGGLLVGLAVSDAFGWPYLGVALPFGMAAAFTAHALLATFRPGALGAGRVAWLAVGVGAALVGNLVEMHLGLAVATDKLYFWLLTGLLAAAFLEPRVLEPAGEAPGEPEEVRASWPWAGFLGAGILATLLFGFVKPSSVGVLATLAALLEGKRGPGQLMLLGIGLATVTLLIVLHWRKGSRSWLALGLALAVAALFGAIQLQTVSSVRDLKNDLPSLEGFARWLLPQYVLVVVALTLGMGAALAGARDRLPGRGGAGWALAAIALLAVAVLAGPLGLRRSEAESLVKIGALFERSSRHPVAAGLFARASALEPREPRYALHLGKVALKAAREPRPPAQAQAWIEISELAFERARELSPFDPRHLVNRARLDVHRAAVIIPGQEEPFKAEADSLYQRAIRMSPSDVVLLNEYALFQLLRRGRLDEAERNLKRSLEMDPDYFYTYTALGQLYVTRGQSGAGDKLESYRKAISYYDRSLGMQFSARTAVALGLLSLEVEDKPTSVARLENALRYGPTPEAARKVHATLARLYQELGQPEKAASHAAQAGVPATPAQPPR